MEFYMVSYWEIGSIKTTRVFNNFSKASEYYNDLYSDGFWCVQIDLCEFIDGELKSVHIMGSYLGQ